MSKLRNDVIKLAYANPDLRPHLLPILASSFGQQGGRPKSDWDREIAKEIQTELKRAGLWDKFDWEYEMHSQSMSRTVGYSFMEWNPEVSGSLVFDQDEHEYVMTCSSGKGPKVFGENKNIKPLVQTLKKQLL